MQHDTRISLSLYPAAGSPRGSVGVASCKQPPLAEGLSRADGTIAGDNVRGSCEHLRPLRQNESKFLWRPRESAVRFGVAASRANRLQLSRTIPRNVPSRAARFFRGGGSFATRDENFGGLP